MTWEETIFGNFVDTNPKVPMSKGESYSFIPMEIIDPSVKHTIPRCKKEFSSGGARFANGDTLFARITPCLEHGKITKAKGLKTDIGFGSTEYIVFRAKDGISDPDFVYYLAKSDVIKQPAIKSMVGSSGRQRAQKEVIENIIINVPKIGTQKHIASILSAYDDLIENNNRRIELLEESARLLYREWFVNFRFPGYENTEFVDGLPKGWESLKIEQVAETFGGGTPSTTISEYWDNGDITWFTPTDLTKNNCLVLLDSEKKITELGLKKSSAKMLAPETILMTSRASIGYFGLCENSICTNQGFISILPRRKYLKMYLLHNLIARKNEIISLAGGATYKEINKTTFRNIEVKIPPKTLLQQFEKYAYDIFQTVRVIKKQTNALIKARDILLPKLMSGEIEV